MRQKGIQFSLGIRPWSKKYHHEMDARVGGVTISRDKINKGRVVLVAHWVIG